MSSQHRSSSNRDILFGLLAVQLDFVSSATLMEAVESWVEAPEKSIGEILVQKGVLNPADKRLLDAVIDRDADLDETRTTTTIDPLPIKDELQKVIAPFDEAECRQSRTQIPSPKSEDTGGPSRLNKINGGRFNVLRPYAKGGLGEIMVAEDMELHREVALKRIQPWHADQAQSRQRFVQEAEITGRLEHPGIVPVYGLGYDRHHRPYYAMRLVQGESLWTNTRRFYGRNGASNALTGKNVVAFRKIIGHFVDVCHAISYAHSQGIIHRDIKPSNVLLGKFGETIVVDWGLAKVINSSSDAHTTERPSENPLTMTNGQSSVDETRHGSTMGTLGYMSPEQSAGRNADLGPTSDVYSLGATFYVVLTGEPPFVGKDSQVFSRIQTGEFRRPSQVRLHVPKPLESICLKAMALEPAQRYATPALMAEEIEHWLADEPVLAHRYSIIEKLGRLYRKHRTIFATAIVLLFALTVGLFVIYGLARAQNVKLKALNSQLIESKLRAEDNLQHARELAWGLLRTADKELSKIPGLVNKRIELTRRVRSQLADLYRQNETDSDLTFYYALAVWVEANLQRSIWQTAAAEQNYRDAIKLLESIEANRSMSDLLANVWRDRAALLQNGGRLAEAHESINQSLRIADSLVSGYPQEAKYRRTKATSQLVLADLVTEFDESLITAQLASRAADQFLQLLGDSNKDSRDAWLYFSAANLRAEALHNMGNFQEAAKSLQPAIAFAREKLAEEDHPDYVYALAKLLATYGKILMGSDATGNAGRTSIDEATVELTKLSDLFETYPHFKLHMVHVKVLRAELDIVAKDYASASTELHEALNLMDGLHREPVTPTINDKRAFVSIVSTQGELARAQGRMAESKAHLQRAINVQRQITEQYSMGRKAENELGDLRARLDEVTKGD